MKKYIRLLMGAVLLVPYAQAGTPGIMNSAHDFSGESWNLSSSGANAGRKGVCSTCHTAHNTDPNQLIPLWRHATTTASYQMYTSDSMNASKPSEPSGASKACLSCHDGTVAVNQIYTSGTDAQYIGGVIADPIADSAKLGTDLRTTHPISIDYMDTGASADPDLYPRTTLLTLASGTFASQTIEHGLLKYGKVECSSCHDIHRTKGNSMNSGVLTVIGGESPTGKGSTLCRSCHNK